MIKQRLEMTTKQCHIKRLEALLNLILNLGFPTKQTTRDEKLINEPPRPVHLLKISVYQVIHPNYVVTLNLMATLLYLLFSTSSEEEGIPCTHADPGFRFLATDHC